MTGLPTGNLWCPRPSAETTGGWSGGTSGPFDRNKKREDAWKPDTRQDESSNLDAGPVGGICHGGWSQVLASDQGLAGQERNEGGHRSDPGVTGKGLGTGPAVKTMIYAATA